MKNELVKTSRQLKKPLITTLLVLALSLTLGGCGKGQSLAAKEDSDHGSHSETKESGKESPGKKMCPEHDMPLAECGICRPQDLVTLKPGSSMKLRLASKDSAEIAGVKLVQPEEAAIQDSVDCYAEVTYNQNRYAQLAAPVGGLVQEVLCDLGQQVSERHTLATLWSASIAEALAKAMLSHQTLKRELSLRAQHVNSEKDLQEAEAAHRASCQQLSTLGFTEEQVDALIEKPRDRVLLELKAPLSGEIVERSAVQGSLVEGGKALFAVADRSTMWASVKLPELALSKVKLGQDVELRLDSLPGKVFLGKLTWIAPELDERTRLAQARVEIPNPEGLLRNRMYAQARILVRSEGKALVLPTAAVHRIDDTKLVFVRLADDLYEVRAVRVGAVSQGKAEILEGLHPGETVAADHGFSLKSAVLISRLGAGCADD